MTDPNDNGRRQKDAEETGQPAGSDGWDDSLGDGWGDQTEQVAEPSFAEAVPLPDDAEADAPTAGVHVDGDLPQDLMARLSDGLLEDEEPSPAPPIREPDTRIDGPSIDDLGPAFPPEKWEISQSGPAPLPALEVTEERKEGPPNQSLFQVPADPLEAEPSEPVDEDAWADYQDQDGWSVITGESQVSLAAVDPDAAPMGFESTGRDGTGAESQLGSARLVCFEGLDQESEFPITKREMNVGRVQSNDIVLSDTSVSRRHAELLHEADGYVLVDLRSANGTFVNGQRVDRARVRSGDEVGFGNVRCHFIEEGDAFALIDASRAPVLADQRQDLWSWLRDSPHFKSVIISVLILAIALGVTITTLVVRSTSQTGPKRRLAFQAYLQAIDAFKRHDWSKAEEQLRIVLGLTPDHERAQRYLEEVAKERKFEKQLMTARSQRQKKNLAEAYAQAATVVDSLFSQEAREMLRNIDAELDARAARARMALDVGDAAEALKLLQSVENVQPGRPGIVDLRDRAAAALRSMPRAPKRPSGVAGKAVDLFADGKTTEALRVLKGQRGKEAQAVQNKIERFNKAYERALIEYRSKRTSAAIKQLKTAKSLESRLTGGHSKIGVQINRKLADMYYVQGISALSAGRAAEAQRSFRAALSAMPNHRPSQRKLKDLSGRR